MDAAPLVEAGPYQGYAPRHLDGRSLPTASVAASSRDIETIQAACRSAEQRKDAHVVATALQARAGTIVTHNIPDFYQVILDEYGLIKRRPDVFLVELISTHPPLIIAGAKAHRASLKTPALSVDDYLAELAGAKASVPKFARALEQHHKADI
jgi:hypothetical protein